MFANPGQHLAPTAEKKVYDQHRNHPGDLGYRHFLNQLLEPLVQCLGALPLCGLDCGSGPGPTLSLMLSDLGYQMSIYDPYYATNSPTANARFDFVTCTEAIEHFYTPWREWEWLLRLVIPQGWLGIMTTLRPPDWDMSTWYYCIDPTHISFLSAATFAYLADRDQLNLMLIGNNVVLLQKQD